MSGYLEAWRLRIAVEHARARGETVAQIAERLDLDPVFVADLFAVQDDLVTE